jgi:hypothetical protein
VREWERKTLALNLGDLCASSVKPAFLICLLFVSLSDLSLLQLLLLSTHAQPSAAPQTPSYKPGLVQCVPVSPVPIDRWQGEYFNNLDLSGLPAMVRNDGDGPINFDWGLKSPDASCGIGEDGFSVRWTRNAAFGNGVYRFTVSADDGLRVFIDGQKRLEQWRDQIVTTYSFDVTMTAGNHEIVFEYYERTGSAVAQLHWSPAPCAATVPPQRWRGEYFNNREMKGKPVLTQDDGDGFLDFDWKLGSPGSTCSLAADDFSARWIRTVTFAPGIYRFNVSTDDGIRFYIDGKLQLDRWVDQMSSFVVESQLAAGNHQLAIEYYEHMGSAAVKLSWEQHPCFSNVPPYHWRGEYFDNPNLAGRPKMVRDDGAGALDFDFALKSPAEACGIGGDDFSVRWMRALDTLAGTYRFTVTADDGVRLFIDGKKQIDEWRNQQPTTFVVDVTLSGGNHRLVVEYFDHTGGGVVKLNWQLIARAQSSRRPG